MMHSILGSMCLFGVLLVMPLVAADLQTKTDSTLIKDEKVMKDPAKDSTVIIKDEKVMKDPAKDSTVIIKDEKVMKDPAKDSALMKESSAMKDQKMGPATVKFFDHPKLGKILTDAKGMTLYTYTDDKTGVSSCKDQCAVNWPPFVLASGQPVMLEGHKGKLDIIVREDKTRQVTLDGKPLYFYAKDQKSGDVNGQGFKDKWFVIVLDKASAK